MMRSIARSLFIALVASAGAEVVFEDSPALSSIWQATSDGSTDAFISQIIQNEDVANHRSSDGRGPVFWAYEFKNVDTLALLMHLGVSLDQEDIEGKAATSFFPDAEGTRAEFEADAKAKMKELGELLSDRKEEFFSYQNAAVPDDDDYDDEEDEEGAAPKKPKVVDDIDYADDEDEEDDAGKDEM